MNALRVISILLIVFSLSTVSIASVFGQLPTADKYENLGIRHDSRPNVCLFEPNPTHVDWDYWKAVEIESWKAVLDWQVEMTEFLPEGDWSMYIHSTVPYEEHWNKTPDDYRHCNIFLTYEAWSEGREDMALGLTGIDFADSRHKFTYIVIFLHAEERNNIVIDLGSMKENNEGKYEFVFDKKQLPLNTIYNIVLHEVGHGLGLGHYWSTQEDDYKRSALIPSLKPFDEDINFEITIADKFQLGRLYGLDGFQKPQPVWIPDHCLFDHGLRSLGCY
jgi:predicted Zn-dependent protease